MIAAIGSVIGFLIVCLAVGIPYWSAHRHLRDPHDVAESHDYLNATGKTPADAAQGRPGRPSRQQGSPEEQATAIKVAAGRAENL